MVPLVLENAVLLSRRENRNVGYVFAACWVLVFLGAFTLAETKLPSYITPCYPGLALLAGSYVDRWSRDRSITARWWLTVSFGILAAVGAAFVFAIPIIAKKYLPGDESLGLLGLTPLAAGAACLGLAWVRNYKAAAATFAASAVAFATLLFAVGAQRADSHQTNHVLLRAIHANSREPQIASFRILEPTWVFYAGQPIVALPRMGNGGSESFLVDKNLAAAYPFGMESSDQVRWFFHNSPESFLITTRDHADELTGTLPADVVVLAEAPRFLREEQLVVLGRAASGRGAFQAAGTSNSPQMRGMK
jgi:hypothetical protein